MKPDYPPLLAPGFVEITVDDLDRIFVDPFEAPSARRRLVAGLREVIALLQDIGLDCELWINGSFATSKPEPSDVDVLVLSDDGSRSRLTVSKATRFDKLIKKKDLTQYRYRCDLSYCERHNDGQRIYWRGLFGFSQNDTAKGIALIRLAAS